MLRIVYHADGQRVGDLILRKVALEHLELLHILLREHVQLCHGRREPADEDGSQHEGQDEHPDSVDPLAGIRGHDFVRPTGELQQGPVQGRGVLVLEGRLLEVVHLQPRVRPVVDGDAVPNAGDDVAEADDHGHDARDACHNAQLLRLNALKEGGKDISHSGKPQQPDHSNDAERPRGLTSSREAQETPAAPQHLDPIDSNDEHVHGKPCPQVLLRNLGQAVLNQAVFLEHARKEGHEDVGSPEQPRRPRQDLGQRRVRRSNNCRGIMTMS
mmetsp:Transcript_124874/g.388732  ORF Transcript_124874/g.388732 Transcript_124874/m.388732 type:complete len:271 (-) Transcript_124874:470-1282(-)